MVIRRDEYLVTTARDLGAALKHYRTAAGVTQQAAAEAEGIGQSYLSSLESGKFGRSLTHALRLLRLVGCEIVVTPRDHVADRLVAWLHGTPVATLTRGPHYRIPPGMARRGTQRWGRVAGPCRSGCRWASGRPPGPARAGLLREHPARRAPWRRWRPGPRPPGGHFGILATFGRDCAGAIMLLPEPDQPGAEPTTGTCRAPCDDLSRWSTRSTRAPPSPWNAASARPWPASSARHWSGEPRWHMAAARR